jgi:integrase
MVLQNKVFLSWTFARKGLSPKTGLGLLQIRVYFGKRQVKFISAKEYFTQEEWDQVLDSIRPSKKKRQIPDLIYKKFQNAKEIWQDIEDYEAGLIHKGKTLTPELFSSFIDKKRPQSFNEFCQSQLDSDKSLKTTTKRPHQNTINKLTDYKARIEFSEIDYSLIEGFDRNLRNEGLNLNSIQGHHKRLGKYITIAINKDLIEKNPYRKFKTKGEEVDRTFLLMEEIDRIEALDYSENLKIDRIKDLFLFGCYTGLRFGDLMALAPDHLETTAKGIQVKIKQQKVNTTVYLPLYALFNGRGEQIIKKYLAPDQKSIFAKISNQKANEFLKYIQHDATINKCLSMHAARHTFGTQMAARTEDPFLIMRLMGHRDVRTSQEYIHAAEQITDRKLEKIEW